MQALPAIGAVRGHELLGEDEADDVLMIKRQPPCGSGGPSLPRAS